MNTIKEYIYTTFEREELLVFLDRFDQIIFDSNNDPATFVEQNLEDKYKNAVLIYLSQGVGSPNDLYEKSKILRQELLGIDVIVLTVPISLTIEQKLNIAKHARSICAGSILVDFVVDQSIVGGAMVESNGRIGEYSFRRYFEKRQIILREQNGI